MGQSVKAGINLATTQMLKQRLVGAGFTPARMAVCIWKSLRLGCTYLHQLWKLRVVKFQTHLITGFHMWI